MRRPWFGPPRGAHRIPEPVSILGQAARVRADAAAMTMVTPRFAPPDDTRPFNPPWLMPGTSAGVAYVPAPAVRWSPVRYGVQVTARASSFRFPLRCFTCGREHRNLNADRFADLYASAGASGWRQDLYGSSWRCPRCARRHNSSFGAHPVAAIEPATSGGKS